MPHSFATSLSLTPLSLSQVAGGLFKQCQSLSSLDDSSQQEQLPVLFKIPPRPRPPPQWSASYAIHVQVVMSS